MSHDGPQPTASARAEAEVDPEAMLRELTRITALLEEERGYFRSELALGAEELARRDRQVQALQVRSDALAARCDELLARRDRLQEQRRRLRSRRDRLVDQRDRARSALEGYESSRLVRLAARVVWRLRRMRGRA